MTGGGHRRGTSKQPAETDDIADDIPDDIARAAGKTTRVIKKKKSGTDDITLPASKQEIAAQPHNSGRNAQFRSEPELYKNDRK